MFNESIGMNSGVSHYGDPNSVSEEQKEPVKVEKTELKAHNVKTHKLSKKYFNQDGTLSDAGAKKLANKGRVAVKMTYTRKSFFGKKKTKTKMVAVSQEKFFKIQPKKTPSEFEPVQVQEEAKLGEVGQTPTGQHLEDAVSEWKECGMHESLKGAVNAKFLADVELASEGQEAVSVTLMRQEGGKIETGRVNVSVASLADSLGVSKQTVILASLNKDLSGLIIRARLTPDDEVKNLNVEAGGVLSQPQAKEMAIAVDGLRDEKLIFGQEAEEGILDQYEFGTPTDLELDAKTETVYAHMGGKAVLGEGNFGIASKTVAHELGNQTLPGAHRTLVAQKIPKGGENLESLDKQIQEAEIGRNLAGTPFVMEVRTYTKFSDIAGDEQVSIVSELCTEGDLADFDDFGELRTNGKFAALKPAEKWTFFNQALAGVHGMHQKGYVHRDLKGPNILVAENNGEIEPRIADFGMVEKKGEKGSIAGSPDHIAPEHFREFLAGADEVTVSSQNDAFAMGLIACELLLGIESPAEKAVNIRHLAQIFSNLDEANWVDDALGDKAKDYPPEVIKAVKGLCHGDPDKRMSIEEAMGLIDQGVAKMK